MTSQTQFCECNTFLQLQAYQNRSRDRESQTGPFSNYLPESHVATVSNNGFRKVKSNATPHISCSNPKKLVRGSSSSSRTSLASTESSQGFSRQIPEVRETHKKCCSLNLAFLNQIGDSIRLPETICIHTSRFGTE